MANIRFLEFLTISLDTSVLNLSFSAAATTTLEWFWELNLQYLRFKVFRVFKVFGGLSLSAAEEKGMRCWGWTVAEPVVSLQGPLFSREISETGTRLSLGSWWAEHMQFIDRTSYSFGATEQKFLNLIFTWLSVSCRAHLLAWLFLVVFNPLYGWPLDQVFLVLSWLVWILYPL